MPTKLLFATDFHFRAMRPISRTDESFFDTQLKKLEEIAAIALIHKPDEVILGGDIFDRPDVPPSVVIKVMRALGLFKKPPKTVIGNHEIYGYEGKSVESSAMGILLENKSLVRLDYLQLKGATVYGIHAFDKASWVVPESDDKKIIVAHKMITNNPIPNTDCILVDTLARITNADVVLSGDIHYPHAVEVGSKLFINPGSVSRMSIADRDRMPQVVMVTIEDDGDVEYEFIQLAALHGDKVFNIADYSAKLASEAHTKDFVKTYASVVFSVKAEAHKIADVLSTFMKDNNVPANMQEMVRGYYRNAETQVLHKTKED